MDKYNIITAPATGSFLERLVRLYMTVGDFTDLEKLGNRQLQYCKIFLSDIKNQYSTFMESDLYTDILSKVPHSIIEQPPLNNSKIGLLLKTSDETETFIFNSFRLTTDEAKDKDSYSQTILLFEKYLKSIKNTDISISRNCLRTWIYVDDIDNNYAGVVKARNDVFNKHGLTTDTHFIASTGIGGNTGIKNVKVAMDFLTYPDIKENDKKYLQALDNLNPTHEYGVAFERGTRLTMDDKQIFFISGTASIDKKGDVVYSGDVVRQAGRLLENIGALLNDGGATMKDIRYLIIYLRDLSDYKTISNFMHIAYPNIPNIILRAKVCRPEWLIEMECVAYKAI